MKPINRYFAITLATLILVVAIFMKIPNVVRNATYTVFREGLKQKALWNTRDMKTVQGNNFTVRYTQENEQDAKLVLSTAEHFYAPIAENYGFTKSKKVPVIVYSSRAALNRNFGWEASESAMGVYWTGIIRVLSPNLWVMASDSGEYDEVFMESGPMAHEFTHLVVDYLTGGNYTRWFTEGLAQYEEFKLTGFELDDPGPLLTQTLYPLAEMDRNFDNLTNQSLAYRQAYLAISYLAVEYGEDSIKDILKSLGQGNKIDKSFRDVLGVSLENFEENYQNWAIKQEKRNQI